LFVNKPLEDKTLVGERQVLEASSFPRYLLVATLTTGPIL